MTWEGSSIESYVLYEGIDDILIIGRWMPLPWTPPYIRSPLHHNDAKATIMVSVQMILYMMYGLIHKLTNSWAVCSPSHTIMGI